MVRLSLSSRLPPVTKHDLDPARRIRTFHVRRGRMSATQSSALQRLGPSLLLPISDGPINSEQLFGRSAPLILEIGSGMGGATAAQAAADQSQDILAVDVHTPGIANLLALAERSELTNVRVVLGDAVEVVEQMIGPDTLAGVRIYFPDPWPKVRHQKRRLVQPAFIELLVPRLVPGGFIHCATDIPSYAHQMLDVLSAHPELNNPYGGFAPRPAERPVTKFEARALRSGQQSSDVWVTRTLEP
jgi:tRNA (guanine-N7-)-methyltransferase